MNFAVPRSDYDKGDSGKAMFSNDAARTSASGSENCKPVWANDSNKEESVTMELTIAVADSSESDEETEPARSFHRKLSTNKDIKNLASCIKEGYLMKQTWSFQRWRKRYFKLKDRTLYYARESKAAIFDEIELTDLTFAECKIKNVNHTFQVTTPFRSLILCSKSRHDMEEWLDALRTAAESRSHMDTGTAQLLSGNHQWYATNHARPTYCNVCRDALYGVTSHGLSCEVCKYKIHKRCSTKAINNCKWTTLASIGKDIIEDQDGNITMPHQWLEGNLPVSSKCCICDKTCGSVLRLQDWRCLWCRATVHTACRPSINIKCPLGLAKLSVVPPTALHSIGSNIIGSDEAWEAVRPTGCSPLLVFVNSKSGDTQGVKFLRRFKQLLNPAQVFDLIKGGPGPGLRLFRHFDPFRILVCSGDGSVGWVLSEIDRLGMHKQCQVGVLPLGTGNDLARVLGWGASCDDDSNLPQLLEKYEKASTKMLDRWSIMTFDRSIAVPCHKVTFDQPTEPPLNANLVRRYEDTVVIHIKKILQSDEEHVILSSAKILRDTIKDFATHVLEASFNMGDQQLEEQCEILEQKLDLLLQSLRDEESQIKVDVSFAPNQQEKSTLEKTEKDMTNFKMVRERKCFMEKESVLTRADSLKRAVRRLAEHTTLMVDERNDPTERTHSTKPPDITIKSDTPTTCDRKQKLGVPGLRLDRFDRLTISPAESGSSGDFSPCSSPTPNLASLSPMPDLRRDSQAEELLTLPVPDSFADSRRNSSALPQGTFNFDASVVQTIKAEPIGLQSEPSTPSNDEQQLTDSADRKDVSSDIQITVTKTTLNSSSPTDDTTVQDTIISPDSDSINSRNASPECGQKTQQEKGARDEISIRSYSNSIVSMDSMVSESLNSKSYTVRNSESEIGHIDSDIFDSTKRSDELSEIGHIDSPENSELVHTENQNSESLVDDISSLGQDLLSTMLGEKYDSVRECLESDQIDKPRKYCSLAQFVEDNDITKRSFRQSLRTETQQTCERKLEDRPKSRSDIVTENKDASNAEEEQVLKSPSTLLSPVCCFAVSSNISPESTTVPVATNFPPAISVIIDPPSPSISITSRRELNINHTSDTNKRQCKGSMENLTVEFAETGCSPQATRRISSGSLLKASEVVSLAATAARLGGSNVNLRQERAKSVDKTTEDVKKLPIINPLVRLPMWPNVSGGAGLISQALLANADALCAAVSPLMDPDETLMEGYIERCVMNNYFGIGIDAKISLDFHHKREEHPEKCRSRAKNYMWYGVLGSKQWLQKTYKNLEQRVQLECDGQRIPLPSLQGIVVLNIPSFMGGTNFWGGTKEGDLFLAPSFDDRILEVVAVFGSVQMAASRLINLQHHRIAQCQTVQINILGEEGVPIQVDGEAWIQPPGIIRIIHKNRMQMLYRNRALETSLRAWEEKQRNTMASMTVASGHSSSTLTRNNSQNSQSRLRLNEKPAQLNDEEFNVLLGFIEVVTTLVKWVKLLIISHPSLEQELYQIAARTADALEQVHPNGKILQGEKLRPVVTELVSSARQLYEESCELLRDKAHNLKLREDLENKLSISLATMEHELKKCIFDESGTGLVYLQNITPDDQGDKKNRHRGLFWLKFRRSGGNAGAQPAAKDQVTQWGVPEVCSWLENLQLGEYTDKFVSHDIRGRELLTLARRDLKELGITKIGHVKRILQAINDLNG